MTLIHEAFGARAILFFCLTAIWLFDSDQYYAHSQQQKTDKSSWLQLPGFKLNARVKLIRHDPSSLDEEIIVHEYYSNVERRAKLDLTILQRHNLTIRAKQEISYYYNGANNAKQLIKVTGGSSNSQADCSLALDQTLSDDLFGSMSRVDGHLTGPGWLREREDVPDYLIGFARLLVIVDSNREKLTRTLGPDVLIRNQEAVRYLLKDSLGAADVDQSNRLMVYYNKFDANTDDLPMRIWFLIKQDSEIVVDYSGIAQIDYEAVATKAIEAQTMFAFPLDSGCSSWLPVSTLIRRQSAPKLISFRASIENRLDQLIKLKYFIAYDGYAGVLRRDSLARSNENDYSITIHDLKKHLKYNIKKPGAKPKNNWSSSAATGTAGSWSQCIVAHHESKQDLLSEPVLPLHGMVAMGRASVRGVDVVVFELLTEQLPEILFPQVSYVDLKGANRSAYIPNLNQLERTYCVIYYFSADSVSATGYWSDGLPLGQLMRIDVMQQKNHLYRVEVNDFVWELGDAPNGDRADDLFALGDRCESDELRAESSANLNIELEFDSSAQKFCYGTTRVTAQEAIAMIGSLSKLNRALADGLGRIDARLGLIQIRDVESKLTDVHANTTFRVRANAKLDQYMKAVYRPFSVAKGRLNKPGTFLGAANFEECLWAVARKYKQFRYMLFSFCYTTCLIDERPIMSISDGEPTVLTSNVFELDRGGDNMPCEIFSLKVISDQIEGRQPPGPRDIWSNIGQNFGGKNLWIPVWPQKVGELIFNVKHLDIYNARWLPTNGGKDQCPAVDEDVLEGIGLLAESSSSIRVDVKRPDGRTEEESPSLEMSYSVCHSSCLASLGCRSFSICSDADQLECLMSNMEFRDAGLLSQIKQRSVEVQATNRNKRGSFMVQVDFSDPAIGYDGEKPIRNNSIELKVDRRCHLYNKRALEMFHQRSVDAITVEINNDSLVAGDSVEQCAELCLGKNMQFFELSAKTRSLLSEASEYEENTDTDIGLVAKIQAQEERHLRSTWCSSFAFIDLNAGILPDGVRATVDSSKLIKRGLCHMLKPPAPIKIVPHADAGSVSPEKLHGAKVHLHKYDFIYSSLYEPQPGIRLLALGAKRGGNNSIDKLTPDEVRKYINQNNDQAFVGAPDLETCARQCFMQNTPVVPWCRSFDFMKYTVAEKDGSNKQQYYCIFNSITVADAKRSLVRDRILVKAPTDTSVSHYEPSDFLSLGNVYLTKLYGATANDNGSEGISQPFRLETISILLIILIALISSIGFTWAVGGRIVNTFDMSRRESVQNSSRSFLNSLVDGGSDITHRSFEEDIVLPDLISSRLDDK